jgi:hypothetical protein
VDYLFELLIRISPYLPNTRLLLSALITVAIFGQLYVAYRVWKPRTEVYVRIFVEQVEAAVGRAARLEIANLSPTGVWVESMWIMAKEKGTKKRTPIDSHPIERLVPAFKSIRVPCDKPLYEAFKQTGKIKDKYLGWAWVRVRYRAHGRWQNTRWERFNLLVGAGGVYEIERVQMRHLASRALQYIRNMFGTLASLEAHVPNVEIRYVDPNNEPLTKGDMLVTAGKPIPSAGDIVQIDEEVWEVERKEIDIQDDGTKTITIRCKKPG